MPMLFLLVMRNSASCRSSSSSCDTTKVGHPAARDCASSLLDSAVFGTKGVPGVRCFRTALALSQMRRALVGGPKVSL